jgi:hypothetical protein
MTTVAAMTFVGSVAEEEELACGPWQSFTRGGGCVGSVNPSAWGTPLTKGVPGMSPKRLSRTFFCLTLVTFLSNQLSSLSTPRPAVQETAGVVCCPERC